MTAKGGLQLPRLVIRYSCIGKRTHWVPQLMFFYITIDALEGIRENHRHHR